MWFAVDEYYCSETINYSGLPKSRPSQNNHAYMALMRTNQPKTAVHHLPGLLCTHLKCRSGPGRLITPALPITVGFELGDGFFLGRLVWFVVDEYRCSETATNQACLGYVSRPSQSNHAYTVLMRANQPYTLSAACLVCSAHLFPWN